MTDFEFHRVATNGITLHVAQAGPRDGKLIVLLHGFPEFWYEWRRQIPALAAAGFRVWAPDQRGYNTSDKPLRVRDYRLDLLADDVAGLIAAAGRERAVVVGHDWGGAAAWWTAVRHPDRVERLAILNVPHPVVMRHKLRTSPRQLLRSWYMFMFQLPWLPEWGARRGNWRDVVAKLRATSNPGSFTDADFDEYRAAWSRPGAYTAMLNWYRAMFRHGVTAPESIRIAAPTLLLWGVRDAFIGREAADESIALCDRGELAFFDDATHWLPHDQPDEVNRRLVAFASG
ncbi:MAG: alpha/beta hydrolase, partial [Pirellulaceae bacterium]|nr:alpha/beta hydrolase [Pirellulaceae bacterium]